MQFDDRRQAGQRLATELERLAGERPVVLALPRGGVPVGHEVARALGAPFDVLIVRKLGAPFQPELGVGAVAEGGALFVDEELCAELDIGRAELEATLERERAEIERRVRRYRPGRGLHPIAGRTVILVDDGVATGGTARAAIRSLRALGPARIVFATPVTSRDAAVLLREEADELVALLEPARMFSIGEWYEDFRQVGDGEVTACLERAARTGVRREAEMASGERLVQLVAGDVVLGGFLAVPRGARGVVLFAPGSGSGLASVRNQVVAAALEARGFATLRVDLLTDEEQEIDAATGELRADVGFLAQRLVQASEWLRREPATAQLRLAYFGLGTGAAAALLAAAARPERVAALVLSDGRPDLAARALPYVRAPTLLLVGEHDQDGLAINHEAREELHGETRLEVVPGAGRLFEEPNALARVATCAADWLERHLAAHEEEARF